MAADSQPPTERQLLLNQAREEYTRAARAGTPPPIESVLLSLPEGIRPELFRELLRIERDFRIQTGKPVGADEFLGLYVSLGPWASGIIAEVFEETRSLGNGSLVSTVDFASPGTAIAAPDDRPTIPGYEIGARLGVGGMGSVYAARHLGLDLPVALKVIRDIDRAGPNAFARFRAEARVVAGISHPNLVRVYDSGEFAGCPYLTMELVSGGPLSNRCGEPGDPREVAALMEPVARAIQFLHDHGVVHRDLKPSNVLLTRDGIPKVVDFGLAKRVGADDLSLTRSRVVLGTPGYMAPEQASGDSKRVGPAADVWALGVLLYELLTGRNPFRDDSYELTVARILTAEPSRPTSLVPGLPDVLDAVCLKCLEKEPENRYPSAAALADDLRNWLDGAAVSVGSGDIIEQHTRWARKIGYEIREFLGGGRTVYVYVARHTALNRGVILRLSTGGVGSTSHAAMRRRGELWAGLTHPNILHLYDYGEAHGQPYLVTELVEGGVTLSQRIVEVGGPLSPAQAAETARQLALALQHSHEQGVVHGGVFPSEVILTPHDVPKLAGFSLSRRLGSSEPPLVNPLDHHSPHAYPPEVLAGQWEAVGPATDVYGLGVTLYTMLTGAPPFAAESMDDVREWVMTRPPEPPSQHNPEIPRSLEDICMRCLRRHPSELLPGNHYNTASALAADLGIFLSGTPLSEKTDVSANLRIRVVKAEGLDGQSFVLPRDARFLIGRSGDCDLRIPHHAISRVHCGIAWDDGVERFLLMDYGARNPTLLNGKRVRGSMALSPGDRIKIADVTFVIEPASP